MKNKSNRMLPIFLLCCGLAFSQPLDLSVEDLIHIFEYKEGLVENVDVRTDSFYFRRKSVDPPYAVENFRQLKKARFVYTIDGKTRIESEELYPDSNGQYVGRDFYVTQTWDNEKAMVLDKTPLHRNVYIRGTDSVNKIRKPTDYSNMLGEPISKTLRDVSANGRTFNIKWLESGQCVISFDFVQGTLERQAKLVLDPEKFFYVSQAEISNDGNLTIRYSSKPRHIEHDIWMPNYVLYQRFSHYQGKQILESQNEIHFKEMYVNIANLDPNLFEVQLTPGTLVKDFRAPITVGKYYGTGQLDNAILDRITKNLDSILDTGEIKSPDRKTPEKENLVKTEQDTLIAEVASQRPPWRIVFVVLGVFAVLSGYLLTRRFSHDHEGQEHDEPGA